jgi:hypothetical protein
MSPCRWNVDDAFTPQLAHFHQRGNTIAGDMKLKDGRHNFEGKVIESESLDRP